MRPERDRFVAGTCSRTVVLALGTLAGTAWAQDLARTPATYKDLPSEIPAKFEPTYYGCDHVGRDVIIPMRDGVKLHTVILVPKPTRGRRGGRAGSAAAWTHGFGRFIPR
jgi:predicted acyl esterase